MTSTVNSPKNIAVLGCTGSIGTQTLDIIGRHPELYRATVLVAGRRVDELIELAMRHKPRLAVIADENARGKLHEALAPLGIETAAGAEAVAHAAELADVDMVVTATVGYSGLEPTIRAIRAGKDIALANKETLVVAGDVITRLLQSSPSRVYPVDSEHSAIYQCLEGEDPATVKRLVITASGGPFRTWPRERIAAARACDALKHPNWDMGAKITIDSATMMNKAFEIIEARWLFGMEPERITAIVHPQSIIHSMVEFTDGGMKAQLGVPDMRLPIAYALGCAHRLEGAERPLRPEQLSNLTFEQPDPQRFPCLTLADTALRRGGNTACIINAANEIAVAAYLRDVIGFYDIYDVIEGTLARASFVEHPEYGDYVASNLEARAIAAETVTGISTHGK
ncbi:MAG: 1-deoxy-D-xylulose-5-phosphate reductoisomerase [Muribaculaceae bacterium]|nr:1-deoxy-D-xylulose-5-phosphate reductoisomerase [Muribaculaceae bacterium]